MGFNQREIRVLLRRLVCFTVLACMWLFTITNRAVAAEIEPIPVILDTDMGNDIDDVFAMGILHALHSRGECKIVAVTVSKNHPLSGPFCDVLNTFYGRADIPIGVLQTGTTSGDGPYLAQVMKPLANGSPVFAHRLQTSNDAPNAVAVLRRGLAGLQDASAVVVAIGPLTNIRDLLESRPDEHSPLHGRELVAAKVRLLVVMAGDFSKPKAEFNIFSDSIAAAKVFNDWRGEVVVCPFEMGEWMHYPEMSLEKDFRVPERHPLLVADLATFGGKRNGFMAWDLVAVLHAIRPDRDYFNMSKPGKIDLDSENVTRLKEDNEGKHRYLIPRGGPERVREAITSLASQPPSIP
ncbi:ribonucleoside hydrolase RihC [Planctopirus ephydatiae]|uniref:Ribonucleoside hydrolase RihC n=1 Tax=Planctopirus ephydatiae TaxID=2528019 RepID=A0A518GTT8_9PLAN|nr:nucleoside hydrolase [Planctopirus ephydatiae]QDV32004.1 ribonucleoside hydrolase RihC [Planctopirus ephydatiae]